jgi:siroheme synthase
VENGTLPGERVIEATLAAAAGRAAAMNVRPPALIVIGETVRMRSALAAGRPQEAAHVA